MPTKNTFFLKDIYDNDIRLDINEDVLKRIYVDNIKPNDELNVNFAFITDTQAKATKFAGILKSINKNYTGVEVGPYDEQFEVRGLTDKIKMNLQDINDWNKKMWDFGYKYDCKLDGWYVGT
jgi:cystathionine beta-lyase family protein involved in aluminum resistance